MHRLFIGLDPPDGVKDALLDLMEGCPGARWQDAEQLHLTLKFIGEVDARTANDVAEMVAGLWFEPFTLTLDALGAFDRRGRLDAVWAGVRPHDAVTALHRKVDTACAALGVARDSRAYLPHVTVARFGRAGGEVAALLTRPVSALSWRVGEACLYESTLGRAGAHYRIVTRTSR